MRKQENLSDFDSIFYKEQERIRINHAKQTTLEQGKLVEKEKRIEAIHKQIIDTGVVDLMQEIANTGRVRLLKREIGEKKFMRAEIILWNRSPGVVMKFNNDTPGGNIAWDQITATVDGGVLTIIGQEKYLVGADMTMGKALGLAVINPDHKIIIDKSWS